MNTRERIDKMISYAKGARKEKGIKYPSPNYWSGYISALIDLKATVKPGERSIDDESS